jgi:hypothetical protein
MNADEKLCPFCAEIIKAKAIKCRHCLADLTNEYKFSATSKGADSRIPHKIERTRNYIWWILFGVIIAIMAFTNPNKKDFKYEIVKKIQESEKVDNSNPFEKLIEGVASFAIDSVTERNNYVLFSIFEIDSSILKIINPETPRIRFLGIGGKIIPLFQADGFNERSLTTNDNNKKHEMNINEVNKEIKGGQLYKKELRCSFASSGKNIDKVYEGIGSLAITINLENGDSSTPPIKHAIIKLKTDDSAYGEHIVDSSGQIDFDVDFDSNKIATTGGGSMYSTSFEFNRKTGRYSLSESHRVDASGDNWSEVKYSGVCEGVNF